MQLCEEVNMTGDWSIQWMTEVFYSLECMCAVV